jgi:hypothetical protein
MLKRSILTFLAVLALLAGVLLSGMPLLVLRTQLDEPTMLMLVCLWLTAVIAVGLVVANSVLKKFWFFRGQGEPITAEQLRQRLLTVNAMACPVTAQEKRRAIIFTWRYRETQWCELFHRLGINRLYELHCHIDADTRTVLLVDRMRAADFLICPDRIKVGRLRIPLPLLAVRTKRLAAIEQYATLAEHDYTLHPREIKAPILGTVLASGWNVRFSLWR